MKTFISQLSKTVLHSFSQIMLQKNLATGLCFCIGIGINSPTMLLGGMIAILTSIVTTEFCQFNQQTTQNGLYSFNAALVGIGTFYFLPVSMLAIVFIVLGAFLATLIMHCMLDKLPAIPPFTAPFVITMWLVLIIVEVIGHPSAINQLKINTVNDFQVIMRGISQIMFQDYWLVGVIFIVGLFISSSKAAIWVVIGSATGLLTARFLGYSEELVLLGGYGLNASLVAIALAKQKESTVPAKVFTITYSPVILTGILISVVMTKAFQSLPLPALTAPFVLTCWLMVGITSFCTRANLTKFS